VGRVLGHVRGSGVRSGLRVILGWTLCGDGGDGHLRVCLGFGLVILVRRLWRGCPGRCSGASRSIRRVARRARPCARDISATIFASSCLYRVSPPRIQVDPRRRHGSSTGPWEAMYARPKEIGPVDPGGGALLADSVSFVTHSGDPAVNLGRLNCDSIGPRRHRHRPHGSTQRFGRLLQRDQVGDSLRRSRGCNHGFGDAKN
jgi:hypothetical protein